VLGVPFRNPALVAKVAGSLQRLSGGRFILGLGGGSSDDEIARLGAGPLTARDKVDGLGDALQIVRGAWTQSGFGYTGRRHSVAALTIEPKPRPAPPIWLGTYGPRALALTGRFADGWIPSLGFAPPDRIPAMWDRIRTAAADAGRDPAAIRAVYNVPTRIDTRAAPDAGTVTGSTADLLDRFQELTALGFSGFNIMPVGDDPAAQVRRFADEVLPALRESIG
jgi:alkanesulfonate monooxygenase SsuD/methylene tetrahydromethanopterin reductase-like flavin-dependent oxidoreductase (luciferase family)